MGAKVGLQIGCPFNAKSNPERDAEEGALGELLIEGASMAWNLNPEVFPQLSDKGPVEVMIERRAFTFWPPPTATFDRTGFTHGQLAEFTYLGRELVRRLGYTAGAGGLMDIDDLYFLDLRWCVHRDFRAGLKFVAYSLDPTPTRLLQRLSPSRSLLDPPSSQATAQACEAGGECATVLERVTTVYKHIETYREADLMDISRKAGLSCRSTDLGTEFAIPTDHWQGLSRHLWQELPRSR